VWCQRFWSDLMSRDRRVERPAAAKARSYDIARDVLDKASPDGALAVSHLGVAGCGLLGGGAPGEPLRDSPTPGHSHAGSPRWVIKKPLDGGGERIGVSRSDQQRGGAVVPTTSGSAPARVATSGVAQAIASIAGSENPSYSDGTTATSADASSAATSLWPRPEAKRTASPSRRAWICRARDSPGVSWSPQQAAPPASHAASPPRPPAPARP
jgi:hypothetical protein